MLRLSPIVLCLSLSLARVAGAAESPSTGDAAPDFSLASARGDSTHLRHLRGQVVFLNFWATWCPPCREELPQLERLYRAYKDSGLVVLGVNVDKKSSKALKFLAAAGLDSLPVLLDPEARVVSLYNPRGMPASFLIDRQGRIRYEHLGFSPEILGEYRERIEQLIGSTSSTREGK